MHTNQKKEYGLYKNGTKQSDRNGEEPNDDLIVQTEEVQYSVENKEDEKDLNQILKSDGIEEIRSKVRLAMNEVNKENRDLKKCVEVIEKTLTDKNKIHEMVENV